MELLFSITSIIQDVVNSRSPSAKVTYMEVFMFTAFALHSNGSTRKIDSMETLAQTWDENNSKVWVDLEAPDEATVKALGSIISVDDECLEDCLHGEQHPRVDEYEGYIFMVLYAVRGDVEPTRFQPMKLAIFCGKRFLITVHRQPLHTTSLLRRRAKKNLTPLMNKGVDHLLYTTLDLIVDNYELLTDKYEDVLEDLEDQSLDPNVERTILEKASAIRRELSHLRRTISSQRELLLPISQGLYDAVSKKLGQRFRHVRDHLTRAMGRVEVLREMLHTIRDNYHSTLANRLNSIMKTLTMFATFMLPLSFLAGIYGMNVKFWPQPDSRDSFWIVLGLMTIVTVGLFYFFRRKNWL